MGTVIERHIDLMIKYPNMSKVEIAWIYKHWYDLKAAQNEVSILRKDIAKHRRDADRLEKKVSDLQQECNSGRKAKCELGHTLELNRRIRHLADVETKKANDAVEALGKESTRVRRLKGRVEELEKEIRKNCSDYSTNKLCSAIRKLARHPCAGKRLAVACHPDKVPPELCEVATEFFRFVQSTRDDSE